MLVKMAHENGARGRRIVWQDGRDSVACPDTSTDDIYVRALR